MEKQHGIGGRADMKPSWRQMIYVALLLAGLGLLAGCGFLLCYTSKAIHYLSDERPGEWIVYPISMQLAGHAATNERAVFRRCFSLSALPEAAPLSIRACEQFVIRVNGKDLDLDAPPGGNWKRPTKSTFFNI